MFAVINRLATPCKAGLMRSMSTIRYAQYGDPFDVLKKEPDDKEQAVGPDQVALEFLAAPINLTDTLQIQGKYPIKPTLPAVGGNEGVAVVTAAGANVKNVKINDRVIPAQAGFGTWRNKAVVKGTDVMTISSRIPVETAAMLAVNPATAYRMLTDFGNLKPGDVVIQNGASGAVGTSVVQIAAARGIKTINVLRNDVEYTEQSERLKALGGSIVCTLDYINTEEFKRLIADLPAPKLAINCISGKSGMDIAKVLAKGGTHVTYAGLSMQPTMVGTGSLIFHDINVKGFWLSEWTKNSSTEDRKKMIEDLAKMVEDGKLRTWVETYPFEEFETALAAVMDRTTSRKVILKMK